MRILRSLRPGLAVRAVVLVLLVVAPIMIIGSRLIYDRTRDDIESQFVDTVTSEFSGDLGTISTALANAKAGDELAAMQTALADQFRIAPFALVPVGHASDIRRCYDAKSSCVPASVPDSVSAAIDRGDYASVWTYENGTQLEYVQTAPIYGANSDVKPTYSLVEWSSDATHDHSQQLDALRSRLTALSWSVIGGAAAITLLGSLLITWRLRRLNAAATRFGHGELDVRLPVRGQTGVSRVAGSFNTMAERMSGTVYDLYAAQTLQQRFVADVSHELRTPLSAMLAADDGLDSPDDGTRARSIELVRSQTRRLVALIADLLEMSRFDAGQATLQDETVDVVEVVHDVVRTVAPDADIRVTTLGATAADVDARRVHTILRNLVANAVQHGAPPVDVIVDGREPDALSVTVADDGAGVPSFLVPVIFDRFARADAARGSDGEHSGLGLAIALENARLHDATITVSTSGRTAFTLRLPRRGSGGPG